MDHLSLLAGGEEHTVADWEKIAAAVLRKSRRLSTDDPDERVWEKLSRRTLDGVGVAPLGTRATVEGLPDIGWPGQSPFTRGTRADVSGTGWDIRPVFVDPDAARTAEAVIADLENGATSVWLTLGAGGIAVSDLPRVLSEVMLDLAPVVLDAPEDPLTAVEAFAALLNDRGTTPAPGTNLGADPIGARFRGLADLDLAATLATVAERAVALGTLGLVVDASAVHDAGASDAQELGYSLAVGAAYLRLLTDGTARGYDVDRASSLLEFRYAATDEQFTTIAKFRAARRLWHRVAELSGVSELARGQVQHAVTSRPMMSKYDPYVNMLRTTVATFAAGVGGASSVTTLPFDAALGLPDPFSRRIARNTASLLVSESHVARVTDPAGGSYAVERLTDDLAEAAWAEFGLIEESGGVVAALDDGSLRGRIEQVAAERTLQISQRRRPITGVSEFPNLRETLPERPPYPDGSIEVKRYGAPFEALRDAPASSPVFLATMGTVAAHTARASFVSNLFAAGGIDTVTAGPTDGVEAVLKGYEGEKVACLTGNDSAYAAWGPSLVAALREAGAEWVIVAGKPTDALDVDDSAAAGVDALTFLTRVREKLETTRKADTL